MKKLILLTTLLCGCAISGPRTIPLSATHIIYEKTHDGEKVWTGGEVYIGANYVSFQEVGSARKITISGFFRTLELQ